MVELIAYTQDTDEDQVVLDLYGDEVVPLKYSIESIINPDKLNTNYSKQFDLPATKNNNTFFKAYYDVTTDGNFNPYKKVDVLLRVDSIEVFNGILQLYEVSYKNGVSSYTVNVYSPIVNLFDEIKDKTINDIDFSNLTHYYSLTHIAELAEQNSINNISGSAIPAKVIYYPWCNWGMVTDGSTQNPNPIFSTLDEPANMEMVFRPWVQLKYIWDKIWEGSSFNYSSTFLNDEEFTNLYMDNNWGDDKNRMRISDSAGGIINYGAGFKLNANFYPTTSFTDFIWQSELHDPYDVYDNTSGFITSPTDNCYVKFEQDSWRIKWYDANDEITVKFVHNSTHPLAPPSGVTFTFSPIPASSFPDEVTYNIPDQEVYLNAGESFYFQVKRSAGTSASTYIKYQYFTAGATNATRAQVEIRSGHIMDIQSNFYANHGSIRQIDFIKDIIKRYNLVLDIDKNDTKNVSIEPYANWIDDGLTLDWSSKVNEDEYKVEVPDNYRRFILSDAADDADKMLTAFNDVNRRVYGSHTKNNTEIEMYDKYDYSFKTGIFSPTIFQPFSSALYQDDTDPLYDYYPITVPIPYIYGDDLKKIKNKPKILHFSGIHDIDANGTSGFIGLDIHGFNDRATGGNFPGATSLTNASSQIIKIPTVTPYYDDNIQSGVLNPAADSIDINYSAESWYVLVGGNASGASLPTLTTHNKFWHRYLNERYNKGVKLLKINADLNASDIYNLSFNDKILIKGQAYYILSVEHYPNSNKLTKLELLKFTNQIKGTCNDVGSIDPFSGEVLDTNGASLSSYCCQLYGYNFFNGACMNSLPWNGDATIGYELGTALTSNMMMSAAMGSNNNLQASGSNIIIGGNNNLYNARMNLVAGADNNLTNAARSAAIGENHEVSTDHAVAMGMGAIAERSGEIAHGYSSTRGRAQCSTLIFTGTTTDANYTEIFIDGDSTKKFTVDQDNDSFIGIEANVLAQRRSNHDSMHKYQHTTFRIEGGVGRPVQVGSTGTKTNNKDSGVSGWTNRYSSGGDYIMVEVKGEASATIDWTVILYVNEMRT